MFLSTKPKVSIIIPTYNRASLLQEAIDSVFNQTYTNWELIIVDDASEDNTERVVKAISDSRVHYIRHSQNKGGADARNTGIDNSQGDYVAFLDSDDLWEPTKLETQLDQILPTNNPSKVVCYTKIKTVNQNSKSAFFPLREKKEKESVAEYLFLGKGGEGLMLTSSLMMAKSLISKTKFRPNLKRHHDLDLVIRLEKNGAVFKYIDKPLSIWRTHERSDRLSRCTNYKVSVQWINKCQHLISRKAKVGFLYRWVFRDLLNSGENYILAEWIVINSFLYRIISAEQFAKLSYLLTKQFGKQKINTTLVYLSKSVKS